jgi:hypothetical protein
MKDMLRNLIIVLCIPGIFYFLEPISAVLVINLLLNNIIGNYSSLLMMTIFAVALGPPLGPFLLANMILTFSVTIIINILCYLADKIGLTNKLSNYIS